MAIMRRSSELNWSRASTIFFALGLSKMYPALLISRLRKQISHPAWASQPKAAERTQIRTPIASVKKENNRWLFLLGPMTAAAVWAQEVELHRKAVVFHFLRDVLRQDSIPKVSIHAASPFASSSSDRSTSALRNLMLPFKRRTRQGIGLPDLGPLPSHGINLSSRHSLEELGQLFDGKYLGHWITWLPS